MKKIRVMVLSLMIMVLIAAGYSRQAYMANSQVDNFSHNHWQADLIGSVGFSPAGSQNVGVNPDSVAMGDFNNDGKLDFATANNSTANVSVRLGNGAGGFTSPVIPEVSVGDGPISVALGDFNNDGKLDFVTANNDSNNVSIRLGNGAGGFIVPAISEVSVGVSPISIAVGDFNNDGKLDFVTANNISNNVSIRLGNGAGGFTVPATPQVTVGRNPVSVAVGDFNNDGKLDFAATNYSTANVSIRLGNGAGGFTVPATAEVAVGFMPYSVALGDFNNDNRLDFAVTNSGDDNVSIRLGDGVGGFTAPATAEVGVGISPISVALGDFNNDDKLDFAVTNIVDDNVSIRLGDGAGGFTAPAIPEVSVGSFPYSVALGDINNDGKLDLATANSNDNTVSILLNNFTDNTCPLSGFGPANNISAANKAHTSVALGDLNNDGKLDLAFSVDNGVNVSGSVSIRLGDGLGGFTAPATSEVSVGNSPTSVVLGDFNNDGKLDFATANSYSNNVSIRLGNGAGGFTVPATPEVAVGFFPYSVAVGDFNNDGKLDFAVANAGDDNVSIRLGDGAGGFTVPAIPQVSVVGSPFSVALGDFNNDGKLDFATANYSAANVSVRLGNGAGGFTVPAIPQVSVGLSPFSVALGDFNNDGKLDFAAANVDSNNVSIRLGDGTGGFTSPATSEVSVGNNPTSVALGDFNNDGKLDFVTANAGDDNVSIRLGNRAGGFTAPVTTQVTVGDYPVFMALADINNDGKIDFATANSDGNSVSVALNVCLSISLTATAGANQSATINTAFATALQATVIDSNNNPVSGATVTFTAPTSGASGTFTGGSNTATATTNASGVATAPTFTANGTSGSYSVTASVVGAATPASFSLTNQALVITINATTGANQSATINTAFATALQATVLSNGNPMSGATVTFTAPSTGASGTFTGGSNTATATTNASGVATAPTFTANGTSGSYSVTASVTGATTPASFSLTNTLCATITLSPSSLPNGVLGAAYPATTITASGAVAPVSFSISSGALPAGLTLSTAGQLSGTPTTAGAANFTVKATDANGCTGTASYNVVVTSLEHKSIYVADAANNRVQVSTDEGASWQIVLQSAPRNPVLLNPRAVTASASNKIIFIADTGNNRILRSIDSGQNFAPMLLGSLNGPQGLAYDDINDRLYIADTGNSQILVVNNGGTAGSPTAVVFAGATRGTTTGKVTNPVGLAVSSNGAVYVADTGNSRVMVNSNGQVNGWSVLLARGSAVGQVNGASGIYVTSQGRILVADSGNNRVQLFNGTSWVVFVGSTTKDSLNSPTGVTVTASGNVLISATGDNSIIRKPLTGTNTITVVAGPGNGAGQFSQPSGMR